MRFDPHFYPYPSRRTVVYARRGMVATSQPLAAQAGLRMLLQGGNAVDAAVATAAALTVLEPTSNGIGGDAFALVWHEGRLYGLNASGPAPGRLTPEALRKAGYGAMPETGWAPVTVPGAPAAWAALSARFGRLPFSKLLEPAIEYAEAGFPVSPVVAEHWARAVEAYRRRLEGPLFRPWFETFAPAGRAPAAGEVVRFPDHARTLQAIAETQAEAFYRGSIAEAIDRFSRETGGFLRGEDLAAFRPEWVEPIRVSYRGIDVWELPPNGQGLVTLLALRLLDGLALPGREDVETVHRAIEALKLAFSDGLARIADPRVADVPVAALLSDAYVRKRRRAIGDRALDPAPGRLPAGGTVYLAAADGDGTMVSFIQSNYMGFGSGLVVPGTGIALHNRGLGFCLEPDHPNVLAPGKRPYHTIIPGFLAVGDRPLGPFGVMGGFMQPQGHLQVVMHLVDFALNPQAALDAPRWRWVEGRTVEFEEGFPPAVVHALERRGHDVRWAVGPAAFGRGEIILRQPDGVLVGAAEPRADGAVAAW
ncbi:MAG: gamma-glutamyltransferase family protein [Hydrogenibacillus schlegelii]|uniref:Gamma-glutamyltransferase family protein n=1 Tax=Hydrogenibacillus schlegelii TaxID=1484 RepID=A0A947CWZ1_HYDSH|nr:gamma-glutamyltransferase family protein [Hydrogenibacillus schlegelii]